jgi:hypothetical protein
LTEKELAKFEDTRDGTPVADSDHALGREHCLSQLKKRVDQLGSRIDPALKSWIDRVIVPGLVREFADRARKPSLRKVRTSTACPRYESIR